MDINMRYGVSTDKIPQKYQMLVTFDDNSFLSFTTSMYGGIYVFHKELDNKYRKRSMESVSPLSDYFNEAFFMNLIGNETKEYICKSIACF